MTEQEFAQRYLEKLNDHQKEAVHTVDGAVLLLAVPGSGKTTVLITRLGYMVRCRNIDPRSILTMTYTVAATEEMSQRYSALFGPSPGLTFCTINSLSNQIINEYARMRQKENPYRLIGKQDAVKMVGDIYQRINGEYPTDSTIKDVRRNITYIKNMMLASDKEIDSLNTGVSKMGDIFREYQRSMKSGSHMDFDDQMAYALQILNGCSQVREYFQNKYPYICVDESQDTSRIQHEIIALLARKHENLFMVGDEDQSIYGFRAAYPEALLNFEANHPGARTLLMEENYRSAREIIHIANSFVRKNRFRREKTIQPQRDSGSPIHPIWAVDRIAQFKYLFEVAKSCRTETAILYRNNDSSLPLIDMLERSSIPYNRKHAEDAFFSHRIIHDITDIIRFAQDPKDTERFLRIYYKVGISMKKDVASSLCEKIRNEGKSIPQELLRYPDLNSYSREAIQDLISCIPEIVSGEAEKVIQTIWYGLRYSRYVELNNLDAGKYDILCMLARNEPTAVALLDRLEVLNDTIRNHRNDPDTKLTLSTVHSSKGLEYDTVYLLDILDGILPSQNPDTAKTKEEIRDYEEDRRIYYVSITRAKNELYLFTLPGQKSVFTAEVLASMPRPVIDDEDLFAVFHRNLCGRSYTHKKYGKGRIIAHCEDRVLVEYRPFEGTLMTIAQLAENRAPLPYAIPAQPPEEGPPQAASGSTRCDFRVGSSVTHTAFGVGTVTSVDAHSGIIRICFRQSRETKAFDLKSCLQKGLLR